MFIGEHDPAAQPLWVSPSVRELWDSARTLLESLGATVQEVDFPLVTNYEVTPTDIETETDYPLPAYFNGSKGPEELPAYAWDDFLAMVNDTASVTTLADVDPATIFPQIPGTIRDRYSNRRSNRTTGFVPSVDAAKHRNGTSIFELPGLGPWLQSLEDRRARDLEQWLDDQSLDFVVWPAAGDVGLEDAETSELSAELTWRNGVARSMGNAAIRQLGVPTVTVSMGKIRDAGMPMGLTFASKAYDDNALLSYAYAFEAARNGRFAPPRTPGLPTDLISIKGENSSFLGQGPPKLDATVERIDATTLSIYGSVSFDEIALSGVDVEVFIDGVPTEAVHRDGSKWDVTSDVALSPLVPSRFGEVNVPDQSLAMVVVLATAPNGRSDGQLIFA